MAAMQNSHVNTIKAEKAFENIQHAFTINTLESMELGGNKLQRDLCYVCQIHSDYYPK